MDEINTIKILFEVEFTKLTLPRPPNEVETTKTSLVRADLNKLLPFISDHLKEKKRLTKEGHSLSSLHSYMPSHTRFLTLAVESDHPWTSTGHLNLILK